MARTPPTVIEFEGEIPTELLEAYSKMLAARSGWVNLLPEVVEPEEGVRRRLIDANPLTSMGTALTARSRRRPLPRLGVAHPQGRVKLSDLAASGLALPAGWRLVSSHARRGLVVDPAPQSSALEQLDWLLEATAALCPLPSTGRFRAELHQARGRATSR